MRYLENPPKNPTMRQTIDDLVNLYIYCIGTRELIYEKIKLIEDDGKFINYHNLDDCYQNLSNNEDNIDLIKASLRHDFDY